MSRTVIRTKVNLRSRYDNPWRLDVTNDAAAVPTHGMTTDRIWTPDAVHMQFRLASSTRKRQKLVGVRPSVRQRDSHPTRDFRRP